MNREDWKLIAGQFDARVLQFKAEPSGWVLVILDKEIGFIRTGFETLRSGNLVFDGGYPTPDEAKRQAEKILAREGQVIDPNGWTQILR